MRLFLVSLFLMLNSNILSYCVNESVFQKALINKSAIEQYEFSKQYLSVVENESEVIRHLLLLAKKLDLNSDLLDFLEGNIVNIDDKSELFGRIKLAISQLLFRQGKENAAIDIISEGIQKKWKENAFWVLNDCFRENGKFIECAIDEYNRTVQNSYNLDNELLSYYYIGEELTTFFIRLIEIKNSDFNISAVEHVVPNLIKNPEREYLYYVAISLCFAVDGQFDRALAIIKSGENKIDIYNFPRYKSDKLNVPLYTSYIAIMLNDSSKSVANINSYLQNYSMYPNSVLSKYLVVAYAMEDNLMLKTKLKTLTGSVLNSNLFKDELINTELLRDKVHSLFDMHALSYEMFGDHYNAIQYWENIINDPKANINIKSHALFSIAKVIYRFEGNKLIPEMLCKIILSNSIHTDIYSDVNALLALCSINRENNAEYEMFIQNIVDWNDIHSSNEYQSVILNLKEK